jgi:hypothetical protein
MLHIVCLLFKHENTQSNAKLDFSFLPLFDKPLSIPDGAVQDLILIRGENITYKNKMVKSRSNTPPKGDNYTSFFIGTNIIISYSLYILRNKDIGGIFCLTELCAYIKEFHSKCSVGEIACHCGSHYKDMTMMFLYNKLTAE